MCCGVCHFFSPRSSTCTYLTPSITLPVISYTCIFHGKCASRTHVSALLHALVAITPTRFLLQSNLSTDTEEDEEALPVTSYACQWKAPRKRKESNLPMSEAQFEKHVYGRTRKRTVRTIEDFNPRPHEYKRTASNHLPALLDKVHREGLCISLLLDPRCRHCTEDSASSTATPEQPPICSLKATILAFRESLKLFTRENS